jgi:hypothetical protein
MQFSPDSAIDPRWFKSYEVSIYGGKNSLDLQSIDRPNGSYDFITLNHVLEFIPNDQGAFSELLRISSSVGVLQVCFSAPLSRLKSLDYDPPTGPHKAWHLYGQDLVKRFDCAKRGLTVLEVEEVDPCTGSRDVVHFFVLEPGAATDLLNWISMSLTVQSRIVES